MPCIFQANLLSSSEDRLLCCAVGAGHHQRVVVVAKPPPAHKAPKPRGRSRKRQGGFTTASLRKLVGQLGKQLKLNGDFDVQQDKEVDVLPPEFVDKLLYQQVKAALYRDGWSKACAFELGTGVQSLTHCAAQFQDGFARLSAALEESASRRPEHGARLPKLQSCAVSTRLIPNSGSSWDIVVRIKPTVHRFKPCTWASTWTGVHANPPCRARFLALPTLRACTVRCLQSERVAL